MWEVKCLVTINEVRWRLRGEERRGRREAADQRDVQWPVRILIT